MVSPGRSLASRSSRACPAPRRLAPAAGAFSLVEILVVIAIIAILAAIILPSLAGSQRTANAAASVANLKQWHSGFAGAVAENDNSMPGDGAGFQIGDEAAWFNRMPPHIQLRPLKSAGTDVPKMRQKSIWINPGAPTTVLGPIPFCYGYNDYLSNLAEPTMKITRVVHPSKTILMAEKTPNGDPNLNMGNIASYYAVKNPLDLEAVCNILFIDGHVDGVKRRVFQTGLATVEDELRTLPLLWQPYENAEL